MNCPVSARIILALAAMLALAACTRGPSEKEKLTIMKLTEKMKTVCVGRFLIDVPAEAKVEPGYSSYAFAQVSAEPAKENIAQFNRSLDGKERDLATKQTFKRGPFLKHAERPRDDVRWLAYFHDELGVGGPIEGYALKSSILFSVVAEWSDGESLRDLDPSAPTKEEQFAEFKRNFLALEPHLKPLAQGQLPPEPGFCLIHGYIAGKNERGESAGASVEFPSHPDIYLRLATQKNDGDVPPGILEREQDIGRGMGQWMDSVRTVRKGLIEVAGMPGAEWLVNIPQDGVDGYRFSAEFPGKPNANGMPHIELDLNTTERPPDQAKPPTLSIPEMVGLWDAIVKSIRLRPGAV